MRQQTKIYLFLSIFFICMTLYFLLPPLYPQNQIIRQRIIEQFNIFNNPGANFMLVLILFALLALTVTKLIELLYQDFFGSASLKPKVGKYLVAEHYITEEDLKNALNEQNMRIGEILVQSDRITSLRLQKALKQQKKTNKRLGEVLHKLGYISKEDISWALSKEHRPLGKILKDNNCITDYDLTCALSMQQHDTFFH